MKLIRILLPLYLLLGFTLSAQAAESTRLQAILIIASNDQGKTDSRLSRYEPTLKRILRFESYRFVGQGSTTLSDGKAGHINLGDGQTLQLISESSGRRGSRVRVIWKRGTRTLMETGLSLRPGVPAVLGGPSAGRKGGVYAVILTGR